MCERIMASPTAFHLHSALRLQAKKREGLTVDNDGLGSANVLQSASET